MSCKFSVALIFILALLTFQAEAQTHSSNCDLVLSPGDSIQAALDSGVGVGSASDKWWVCLDSGTYTTTKQIELHDYQVLRGEASARPTIVSNHSGRMISASSANVVYIQNLNLQPGSTKPSQGITLYNSSNVSITGTIVYVENAIGHLVKLSNNVDITYGQTHSAGGQSHDVQQAIWVSESSHVSVQYHKVLGPKDGPGGDGAMTCFDSYNVKYRYNESTRPGSSAIYIHNCDTFEVVGNDLSQGSEWGIDVVDGSSNGLVSNNVVTNFRLGAMTFTEHAGFGVCGNPPYNVSVTSNTMSGNNTSGVADCSGINITPASSSASVVIGSSNVNYSGPVSCLQAARCQ